MNPSPVQYQNAGNYPVSLVVTNSSGCRDSVSTNIDAYPIPVVSAGPDTLICQGTGRMLNATGANTYQWSPATGLSCTNCQNPIATPAVETQYIVTGTTIHGCSSIDSVTVSVVLPLPDDNLWWRYTLRRKINQDGGFRAHHYQWSPAAGLDDPTAATPIASPQSTTIIWSLALMISSALPILRISGWLFTRYRPWMPDWIKPSMSGKPSTWCQRFPGCHRRYLDADRQYFQERLSGHLGKTKGNHHVSDHC